MNRRTSLVAASLLLGLATVAVAQRRSVGGPRGAGRPFAAMPNMPYDGRFAFVRVSYETAPGGYWYRGLPAWAHGYPTAELNLMKIMNEVSGLGGHDEGINVLALDDEALMQYPVAYIIEVSWWTLTDREAAGLRAYLQKGGFVIVDDTDISQFWEWSGRGLRPVPDTNEAYKLGVNYIMYGLTH
jgi:hypothetical protein